MKIETYHNRFDLPVEYLEQILNPVIKGKNGKWYAIKIKGGLPVATCLEQDEDPDQLSFYEKGVNAAVERHKIAEEELIDFS